MTHIFQPLDLTVNGAAKVYKKKQITEWHNIGIVQERYVESISIQLKMSALKSLQGKWTIDLFDYFTPEEGRGIISKGWKAAFIKEAIFSCTSGLEPLDPISLVDPKTDESDPREAVNPANEDVQPFFVTPMYTDDNANAYGKWIAVDDGESLNNIFDALDDMQPQ